MSVEVAKLRARGDLDFFEKLKNERLIKRLMDRVEALEEKGPLGTRRKLLATALRLTPSMSPELSEMTESCRKKLGVEIPLEIYVYPSASFNAACVKPEAGRLFIMLSSSLLEAFSGPELKFVMGHELGHYVYGHHDIPIGLVLNGKRRPRPELTLQLFAWSRYAEISADRAGLFCAQDPDAAAQALFRLASGLRTNVVRVRIDDFAQQVEEMQSELAEPGEGASASDWFSTHPFSPLRVKAIRAFARSQLFSGSGMTTDELEAEIQTLLALMEPSYLEEKSDLAETMRRLLFAAAITVADADGEISEAEISVFEKFFGADSFSSKLSVEAIKADLENRIEKANQFVPEVRRIQVLRDLCLMAKADGKLAEPESHLIRRIAQSLALSPAVVEHSLECDLDLD